MANQGMASRGTQELLDEQAAMEQLAARVDPAVVHIEAEITAPADSSAQGNGTMPFQMPFPMPFQMPGPQTPQRGIASGSGVIVNSNGTIITNRHVVQGAKHVTVTLTDHRIYTGVVYSDPNVDLAVVKINATERLPYLQVADSHSLQIGQLAFAIGYPFNVGESVSKGIVSALGRSQTIEGTFYPNLIQTDASINPGNSGGALVNIEGQLIGINTAIAGAAGQSAGIGFAIPSSTVAVVYPQLIGPDHKITNYPKGWVRGKLGVEVRTVTPDLVKVLGTNQGALVVSVQPGSAADKAGVQAGDVVTMVNNTPIRDSDELVNAISDIGPNEHVTLTLTRDRHSITRAVVTGGYGQQVSSTERDQRGKIGVTLSDLTEDMRTQLNVPASITAGAVVTMVRTGSPAEDAGLAQGDIITKIDGAAISSAADATRALGDAHPGDTVGLTVVRSNTPMFVVLHIPAGKQD
jgi:S1-C subfamily serine protease